MAWSAGMWVQLRLPLPPRLLRRLVLGGPWPARGRNWTSRITYNIAQKPVDCRRDTLEYLPG
jgi:hypothetical protein